MKRPSAAHSLLLIVAVLLLAAKLALIDRVETPLRRANLVDGRLSRVDVPTEITFGDKVTAGAFMHPVLQCLDGS